MNTYCPKCGASTLQDIPVGDRVIQIRVRCPCQADQWEKEEEEKRYRDFLDRLEAMERRYGITDRAFLDWSFDGDDTPGSPASGVCRKYVENWEEMRQEGIGLLLFGSVGTGKTFLSSAVVNALRQKQHTATVTSFPRLLNLMQNTPDRQGLLDHLCAYELLVIDDLGVERDSAYALEQVFTVLDARARSGKPLIITTNLTLQELQNPATTAHRRIYDRVLQMCPIHLKMTGPSRRTARAEQAREKARKLLL